MKDNEQGQNSINRDEEKILSDLGTIITDLEALMKRWGPEEFVKAIKEPAHEPITKSTNIANVLDEKAIKPPTAKISRNMREEDEGPWCVVAVGEAKIDPETKEFVTDAEGYVRISFIGSQSRETNILVPEELIGPDKKYQIVTNSLHLTTGSEDLDPVD